MDIQKINEMLKAEGFDVEVREVTKGSEKVQGIMFHIDNKVACNIYPDVALTDEENVKMLINKYEMAKNNRPEFDLSNILEWDKAKDNLLLCIRKPVDDDLLTIEFLDMQLYLKVCLSEDSNVSVKKDLADKWGVKPEVIFNVAKSMQNYHASSMFEAIRSMDPDFMDVIPSGEAEMLEKSSDMWVVSNSGYYQGASAMANADFMKAMADRIGGDFIILPSSVHEIICVGADDINTCSEMVSEVNQEVVDPCDRLSDHAYKYIAATGEFEY